MKHESSLFPFSRTYTASQKNTLMIDIHTHTVICTHTHAHTQMVVLFGT